MGKCRFVIILLIICAAISLIFAAYLILNQERVKEEVEEILGRAEDNAYLTEYTIYGTHLNLKGEINENISEINEVNLVLAGTNGSEEKYKLNYEMDNRKNHIFYIRFNK